MLQPNNIGFRKLDMNDLPMMHRWLNTPAVNAFYGNPNGRSYDEVTAKYGPRSRGERHSTPYVILYEHIPIGYIQTYLLRNYPDYARPLDLQEEAASLDVFIGEESYMHKGLGSGILRKFLQTIIFTNDLVQSCVITPEERNTSAIRAYKKAGFKSLRTIDHPGEPGPIRLLHIGREEFMQQFLGEQDEGNQL